jgi:hypothetical protein
MISLSSAARFTGSSGCVRSRPWQCSCCSAAQLRRCRLWRTRAIGVHDVEARQYRVHRRRRFPVFEDRIAFPFGRCARCARVDRTRSFRRGDGGRSVGIRRLGLHEITQERFHCTGAPSMKYKRRTFSCTRGRSNLAPALSRSVYRRFGRAFECSGRITRDSFIGPECSKWGGVVACSPLLGDVEAGVEVFSNRPDPMLISSKAVSRGFHFYAPGQARHL